MKKLKSAFSKKDKASKKREPIDRATKATSSSSPSGVLSRDLANPPVLSTPPTPTQRLSLARRKPPLTYQPSPLSSLPVESGYTNFRAPIEARAASTPQSTSISHLGQESTSSSSIDNPRSLVPATSSVPEARQESTVVSPSTTSTCFNPIGGTRHPSDPPPHIFSNRPATTACPPPTQSVVGAVRSPSGSNRPASSNRPVRRKAVGSVRRLSVRRESRFTLPLRETASSTNTGSSGSDSPTKASTAKACKSLSNSNTDVDIGPAFESLRGTNSTFSRDSAPRTMPTPPRIEQSQSTSTATKSSYPPPPSGQKVKVPPYAAWPPPSSGPKFKVPPLAAQKPASTPAPTTQPESPQSGPAPTCTTTPTTEPSPPPHGIANSSKPPTTRSPSPTPESLAQARLRHEVRTARLRALAARDRATAARKKAAGPTPTSPSPKPQETRERSPVRSVAAASTSPARSAQQPPLPQPRLPQKQRMTGLKPVEGPKFKVPVLSESEKRAIAEAKEAEKGRGL